MTSYQLCNTEFDFSIVWGKKRHTLHAKLADGGTSLEKREVTFGHRLFYFQNNRPLLAARHTNKAPHWQIIKGLEYITDRSKLEDANLMFEDIFQEIEKKSTGKKDVTFQQVRNKQ